MVAVGALLLYTGRVSRVPSYWEKSEGVIISSLVRETNGRRIGEIQFQYEVAGQRVLGRQLHFLDADRAVRDLPNGKKVVVHYDPAQPEHSRLDEAQQLTWRLAIAAMLMGGGIGLALWGIRRAAA
jgi:hypothetical protein